MEFKITPHFQPIISVHDGTVFGFEVLGRKLIDHTAETLGPYFGDQAIPDKEKLETDRIIRKKAFRHFSEQKEGFKLFININPAWILSHQGETRDFPTISYLKEYDISGENIVIEITEHQFNSSTKILNELLDRYREFGCLIAVDDFSFENFDRLIDFRPDIVKIDRKLIVDGTHKPEYSRLIRHITRFSEELGIAVLFEGIENEKEAQKAMEWGGSLMQGFIFSKAQPQFSGKFDYFSQVETILNSVVYTQTRTAKNVMILEGELNRLFHHDITKIVDHFDYRSPDNLLHTIKNNLPEQIKRLYICRSDGCQISSNFTKLNGDPHFTEEIEFRGKNWGWRPYFIHNIIRTQHSNRGHISLRYKDIKTMIDMRTFTYHLTDDYFLFVDIESDY